jgi:hypothetical protein
MEETIILYDFQLSEYIFAFTISRYGDNYILTYIDKMSSLGSYKIGNAIEYISYLDMMKELNKKLINFKNKMNFEYNPPDNYITSILGTNLNVFIQLKNEKMIKMQAAYVLFDQTISNIESSIDTYKFLLVVENAKKSNHILLQYADICVYIMKYL